MPDHDLSKNTVHDSTTAIATSSFNSEEIIKLNLSAKSDELNSNDEQCDLNGGQEASLIAKRRSSVSSSSVSSAASTSSTSNNNQANASHTTLGSDSNNNVVMFDVEHSSLVQNKL